MRWPGTFVYVGYYKLAFGILPEPFDLALDVTGLIVLLAMTVTSFHPVRRHLNPTNWRRLHKTGIYVLWFLPTWFYLEDSYQDHTVINFAAVTAMLGALAVRGIASTRWRRSTAAGALVAQSAPQSTHPT